MNHSRPIYLLAFVFFILLFNTGFAQQKIIGTVVNETKIPLGGASVSVKNSAISTVAGDDGSFAINAKKGDKLEISFTGYIKQEIKVDSNSTIKVILQMTPTSLDEVIVTGYTAQKVKEITGSVAVVKPSDLITVPAGQVEQMLQGRVAGLTVITSGEPGGASNVRLHGIGNFGDVTPLYIIDGIQGDINNINPYDIESLQVLKDAGAYAIYGVRGANGVILVTTKKGRAGKAKLSYDFYIGKQYPLKERKDLLTPMETGELRWLAYKNSGFVDSNGYPTDELFGNGPEPVLPDYLYAGPHRALFEGDTLTNPDLYNIDDMGGTVPIYQIARFNKDGTDWFHQIFQPAVSQNHTVTASGGNENNHFLFSLGYLNQNGTLLNTYLERYTARVNTDFMIGNLVHIGENLQVSYRESTDEPTVGYSWLKDAINSMYGIHAEWLPVYDIKGNFASEDGTHGFYLFNPVAERIFAVGNDNKYTSSQISGNVYGEVNFLKHFSARSSFGGNLTDIFSHFFLAGSYASLPSGNPNNSLEESSRKNRSWTWTNTLNFSKIFLKHHSVKILIGTEAINSYNYMQRGSRIGYLYDDPNFLNLSNGYAIGQLNYSSGSKSTLFSLLGQLDYGINDKYFIRITLRRDGASVFAPENKYGLFPAVSGAWRISKENFMTPLEWLSELKLRASWGKTGFNGNTLPNNQYNSYFPDPSRSYYDIRGSSNLPALGLSGLTIGNPGTGWQEDIVTNLGLDIILWNGKLSITTDWYKKTASGLLFPAPLPVFVIGDAAAPNINVGNVQNSGIDLLMESKGKFSRNWSWDLTGTLAAYRNKITKLNGKQDFMPGYAKWNIGEYGAVDFVRNEIGHSLGEFYGYKIIGLFKDDDEVSKSAIQDGAAPGRFKFYDANNDGRISSDSDRVFIGNPNPKFTLGFNIEIHFKQFDFSTFFYGSFGNDVVNLVSAHRGDWGKLYDSWTPKHINTEIPKAEAVFNFSNDPSSTSYLVENGSYLRNKSLMIGYSFPQNVLQKIKMERLRIYIQAVNLFTITDYTGLDPEVTGMSSAFAIDNGYYPSSQRQFLAGFTMNF